MVLFSATNIVFVILSLFFLQRPHLPPSYLLLTKVHFSSFKMAGQLSAFWFLYWYWSNRFLDFNVDRMNCHLSSMNIHAIAGIYLLGVSQKFLIHANIYQKVSVMLFCIVLRFPRDVLLYWDFLFFGCFDT